MKEKFFEQTQSKQVTPEEKAKTEQKETEVPKDIQDAILNKGEYDFSIRKDAREASTIRIDEWLSTARTKNELDLMIDHIYDVIWDNTGGGEDSVSIFQELLSRQYSKNLMEKTGG